MGASGRCVLAAVTAGLAVAVSGCAGTGERPRDELDLSRAAPLTGPPGAPNCSDVTVDPMQTSIITTGTAHSLEIPPQTNWNNAPLRLTPLSADYDYVGVSVRPRGQRFEPAAKLTISFDHCPDEVEGPYKIYRWDYQRRFWDKLEESQQVTGRRVQVDRATASDYALGST